MATIAQMQPTSQVLAQDMLNYNNPKLVYVQQAGGMLVASQPLLQQPTANNGQVVYFTRGQQAMAVPSNTLQPVLPQAVAAGPRPMLQQQQQPQQQQAQNVVYVNVNGALKPAIIQNGSIYLLPEAPAQPQQVQMVAQPNMGGQLYMQQPQQQQLQQQQQQQVFAIQAGNTIQQQQQQQLLAAKQQGQPMLVQLPQQQQPGQVVQQHPQMVAMPRPMVLQQAAPPQQRVMGPGAPVMVSSNPPGLVLPAQGEPMWIATSTAGGAPQLVRLGGAQAAPPQQQQQQQQQFQQHTVLLQTTGGLPGPVMPIHSNAAPRPTQLAQLQPMQLQAGIPSSGAMAAGAGMGMNVNAQQLLMQPMVLGKAGGVGGGPATIQINASALGAGQPGMLALSEGLLQPMQAQQQQLMGEVSQGLGSSSAPAGSAAAQPTGAPATTLSEQQQQQQQQTMFLTNLLGIGNATANLAGGSPHKAATSTAQDAGAAVVAASAGLDTRRVSDAPPASSMALLLAGLTFPDASAASGTPGPAEGGAWALAGSAADASGGLLGGTEVVAVGGGSSLQQRLHGLLAEEAFKAGVTLDGLQLPAASGAFPAHSTDAPTGVVAGTGQPLGGGVGGMEGSNSFNAFGFSFFSGAMTDAPVGGAAAGLSPTLGGGGGALGALLSGLRLGG